jgi:HK97 gp10 family phage protein
MSFEFTLEGADAVLKWLSRVDGRQAEEINRALKTAGRAVADRAAANVPRDTGRLAEILQSPEAVDAQPRALLVYAGITKLARAKYRGIKHVKHGSDDRLHSEGVYAVFVEYGTKGHSRGEVSNPGVDRRSKSGRRRKGRRVKRGVPARPAQPFLRPALEASRGDIVRLVRGAMSEAIAAVGAE